MRLKAILIPTIAFMSAGVGATIAAQYAVSFVEERSVIAVQERLMDDGFTWARVQADGLQIILEGEAPTEAIRYRAMSTAGEVVDASRVIGSISVADAEEIAPPDFAIEILRNDSGVSLIGLIPASTNREELTSQIESLTDQPVADLLNLADYPAPQGWGRSLEFAIEALGDLPRSKISVAANAVSITASSESIERQRTIEAALQRSVPDTIDLDLTITAPRPVITPFTVRFVQNDAGTRFDACAADTEETQRDILASAIAAGASNQASCTLGLGVPTNAWGAAVVQGIEAVSALGGGTLTFSDADVRLVALEGTDPTVFDRVIGDLTNDLPDVFALDATLPVAEVESDEGPPVFSATLSPEGEVQLRGRVADDLMNLTIENFASAKFGNRSVRMGTRITEDLPRGWPVRVLAAVEALSYLSNGAVIVEPDTLTVRGNTGDTEATAAISRLMIEKLGADTDFSIDVNYVEALDPIAGLPTPEECVAQIIAMTEGRKITFDPGSTILSASAQPIIDDIAEIFRRCPDLEIEIAGFTDSQGREVMNRELSQSRANAVLDALRQRRIPVGTLRAVGYGEEEPIADNGTEEGREANRRIEFRLIQREEPVEEPTLLEQSEAAAPNEETETETAEE